MSTCRSCGEPVRWVKTSAGKNMPLDPHPVPNGNIELVRGGHGWVAEVVDPDPEVLRYVSHFVTCPDAKRHRRPVRVS